MKRSLVLIACIYVTSTIQSNNQLYNEAAFTTKKIFGEDGVRAKKTHHDHIHNLVYTLFKATHYQRMHAARMTARYLESDISKRKETTQKDGANISIEHSLFVLENQHTFLINYAKEANNRLSFFDKLKGRFHHWLCIIKSYFGTTCDITIESIAQDLDQYCFIEREHILIDYQKTLQLLSSQSKVQFPKLLYFWRNKKRANELLVRTKQLDTVKLQMDDVAEEVFAGVEDGFTEADSLAATTEVSSVFESEAASNLNPEQLSDDMKTVLKATADALENEEDPMLQQVGKDMNAYLGDNPPDPSAPDNSFPEPKEISAAETSSDAAEETKVDTAKKTLSKTSDNADKEVSGARKAWNGVKRGWKKVKNFYEKYINGPYKKYIYKSSVEDNALKKAMDSLPGPLRMVADMSLQMDIMQGGGLVIYWAGQDDADKYKAYATENKNNFALLHQFSANLLSQKALKMKTYGQTFSKTVSGYATDKLSIQQKQQTEINYLESMILEDKPQSWFLDNAALSNMKTWSNDKTDQLFALSAMLNTPGTDKGLVGTLKGDLSSTCYTGQLPMSGVWHNVYQQNWNYFPKTGTFYCTDPNQGATIGRAAIFTEYYPQVLNPQKDTLQVEVTINTISYPFYVGVECNRARWISAVPDQINTKRFCGFFGVKDKSYIAAVESIRSSADGIKANLPRVQSPYYQISNNPQNYSKTPFALDKLPVTYTFTIQSEPTSVNLTVAEKTTVQSTSPSKGTTVSAQNLSPKIFNYHGIGLIAYGCTASFKILQPTELASGQSNS